MTDSHRMRPILDTDQDVAFAVSRMRPLASDPPALVKLIVDHFTVDLDLLAEAVAQSWPTRRSSDTERRP